MDGLMSILMKVRRQKWVTKISALKNTTGSEDPDTLTIFQIIVRTMKTLTDKTAIILISAFTLLILWGSKGNMKILSNIFGENWPGALFPGIPWHSQLASFVVGFLLLVVIPCCIIKFVFKERLSEYGLGWPKDNNSRKLGVIAFFVILGISIIPFYLGTFSAEIQEEYPLFRNVIAKGDWGAFIIYELVYFLFFFVIEFIYRGYLLFGLYKIKDMEVLKDVKGLKGPLVFGVYAILIQMLSYTMWHISKPSVELIGTVFWGIGVGAVALRVRSIWPIIIAHWVLNSFMDMVLWLRQ
ncbi:MAG: CPBP family intramembrane metalloprotease [Candidatus Aminicenantes bacterium]|nr:MAG: CPBP family intramembrane metalloprotease [Candidatus Aminicenantes bacterium]